MFVFAEAYRETDPLARVTQEQMSQHIAARHGEVAEFVDSQVSADDLDHVPAPKAAPSPTQQRWMDAARAEETVEEHGEQVARAVISEDGAELKGVVADRLPPVLDADVLRSQSDTTIANLLDSTPGTSHALFVFKEP